MRILLLHPEDSPRHGPWSRQRWDLIVDLGRSSRFSAAQWKELYQCPILTADLFRGGVADVRQVREILAAGRGQLIDQEGIDWWDLNLRFVPEALAALTLQRIAGELSASAEIWSTREAWQFGVLSTLCNAPIRIFGSGPIARVAAGIGHYSRVFGRFSSAQIKEIFLDKYDSSYRWRSRFASKPQSCEKQVVLLPSAYLNVSRMAAAYAKLLPEQPFLLIAARNSARLFDIPENVQVRELAAYATSDLPTEEIDLLLERWSSVLERLQEFPELRLLTHAGILRAFPGWVRDGLGARNAWREVLEREPVCGVLCGDDSNMTTRIPVLLATRRGIATADFHHGAFDGRYLLKNLVADRYLTKSAMEKDYLSRVCGLPEEMLMMAAPKPSAVHLQPATPKENPAVVFFSEPYELAEMRADEVYREVLPPLCRLAQENGRSLIVKLHPFESRAQRGAMIRSILSEDEARAVTLIDGPLTAQLMSKTWFGITIESTAVVDCLEHGVRCFLCAWLTHSSFGYLEQYVRFGVGEILDEAQQIGKIPERLAALSQQPLPRLWEAADTGEPDIHELQHWLTSRSQHLENARSVS